MKKKYVFILSFLFVINYTYGQNKNISFFGLHRTPINYTTLRGNAVSGDTISNKQGTGGFTFIDLGIVGKPSDKISATAIMRGKNEFGAFFNTGASAEIRQITLEGTIADKFAFQVGDIDIGLTPYTFYNNDEIYNTYEADIFKIRRDVVHYENFNNGNKWRVQGFDASTKAALNKKILKQISFRGFATRSRANNQQLPTTTLYYLNPDRLLVGGKLGVIQSKYFKTSGNLVHFFDITGTSLDSSYSLKNTVLTNDFEVMFLDKQIKMGLRGEAGQSFYRYSERYPLREVNKNDYFYDASLFVKNKKIKLEVGYRNVGPQFYSPSAQSLRIINEISPSMFPTVNMGNNARVQTLLDRVTDLNIYNKSITQRLMPFLPQYGNVQPYGIATPNRSGFTANISNTQDSLMNFEVGADLLSEIVGEGSFSLRKFTSLRAGNQLNLYKLINTKRIIQLRGAARMENTTRSGSVPVNFKSLLVDAGALFEIAKRFDFSLGYKYLNASGNEYLAIRDDFNDITSFNTFEMKSSQGWYTVGLQYRIANNSIVSLHSNLLAYQNKQDAMNSFNINQIFLFYSLGF
ncbi:MAG: hypothetical protein NZ529_06690 [Cytophagaceae bacterium]|nr:hypothetical protein [Cytophagaceae bacterium]MDW8456467.1 hypothetical protein [Cytophagaceae bacterium]